MVNERFLFLDLQSRRLNIRNVSSSLSSGFSVGPGPCRRDDPGRPSETSGPQHRHPNQPGSVWCGRILHQVSERIAASTWRSSEPGGFRRFYILSFGLTGTIKLFLSVKTGFFCGSVNHPEFPSGKRRFPVFESALIQIQLRRLGSEVKAPLASLSRI